MPKMVNLVSFWKSEATYETVLPDLTLLIGQKLMENAKIQNGQELAKLTIFGIFE